MNERIRLLAEQADIKFDRDINEIEVCVLLPSDLEKFAELIVQEAIEACEKNSMLDLDAWQRSEQIKKHFGVEE
jgi:hypothetical protein